MRTTLNLDDAIVQRASELTGIDEKTALIHLALKGLIAKEAASRLAKLGGTQKKLRPTPRRKIA